MTNPNSTNIAEQNLHLGPYPYKLVQQIARTRMSEIWLSNALETSGWAIIKLALVGEFTAANQQAIQTEARILPRLEHESLLKLYPLITAGDNKEFYSAKAVNLQHDEAPPWFIAMEYAQDGSLKELVENNSPLPVELVLQIIKQIANTLAYLHQNCIIHRDVKMSNIVFRRKPDLASSANTFELIVIDFGIAIEMELAGEKLVPPQGSRYWETPEVKLARQNKQELPADYSWDIYGLGLLLHCMLVGKATPEIDTAVRGTDISLATEQFGEGIDAQVAVQISTNINQLIQRAVSTTPSMRPTAVEFETEVGTFLALLQSSKRSLKKQDVSPQRRRLVFSGLIRWPFAVGDTSKKVEPPKSPVPVLRNVAVINARKLAKTVERGVAATMASVIVITLLTLLLSSLPTARGENDGTPQGNETITSTAVMTETAVATMEPESAMQDETLSPSSTIAITTNTVVSRATTTVTPAPTITVIRRPTSTAIPTPTNTATSTPTSTFTPTPTSTFTPTPTSTFTPTPTSTFTPPPTSTFTPPPVAASPSLVSQPAVLGPIAEILPRKEVERILRGSGLALNKPVQDHLCVMDSNERDTWNRSRGQRNIIFTWRWNGSAPPRVGTQYQIGVAVSPADLTSLSVHLVGERVTQLPNSGQLLQVMVNAQQTYDTFEANGAYRNGIFKQDNDHYWGLFQLNAQGQAISLLSPTCRFKFDS